MDEDENVGVLPGEKKRCVEEWSQFPLQSFEDVISWRDEHIQGSDRKGERIAGPENPHPLPPSNHCTEQMPRDPLTDDDGLDFEAGIHEPGSIIGLSKDFQDTFLW
jgi:hypothetical protein